MVVPSDLLTIPKRGGPCNKGVKGRQLEVDVNHFPMTILGEKRVNYYDVDITTPWRRTNRKSDEPLFRVGLRWSEEHLHHLAAGIFWPGVVCRGGRL